ncbi:hypothetical protein KAS31_02170 [Candidatus Parcubacteria bacterium]|nr:hypothetical protein [Candidatus Parcubacteria bacterium]
MKDNKEIQEEFTEAEQVFLKARSKLRSLSGKGLQYMEAFEDYNKARQRLQDIRNKIMEMGTVLFSETVYSVRCGKCGHTDGIYCDKPSDVFECDHCGGISQIEHGDAKNKMTGTVLLLKTVYSIRCGGCGYTNGIYCERPSNTLECICCGETSQIEYEIVKAPSY